jgi:hypothetical protein
MKAKTKKEKYQKIMEKKIATTPEELCKTLPGIKFIIKTLEEFVIYMHYCRGLQFEEKPDYNYIKSMFKSIFDRYTYEYDFKFDWNMMKLYNEIEAKSTEDVTKKPIEGKN